MHVCFSFSVLSQEIGSRERLSKMTYFVSSGTQNNSINQSFPSQHLGLDLKYKSNTTKASLLKYTTTHNKLFKK